MTQPWGFWSPPIFMSSLQPCADVDVIQRLRIAGWEFPPQRVPLSPQKPVSWTPHPKKKKRVRSPKIWRIIFYSTYGKLKGLVPVGQLCCETPCHWILPDPISILIGSSGTPISQASVVLFHPVPAFIAVLSALFSLDYFSVASTEESQLSREEEEQKKKKSVRFSGHRRSVPVTEADFINLDRDQIRTGKYGTF